MPSHGALQAHGEGHESHPNKRQHIIPRRLIRVLRNLWRMTLPHRQSSSSSTQCLDHRPYKQPHPRCRTSKPVRNPSSAAEDAEEEGEEAGKRLPIREMKRTIRAVVGSDVFE